MLYIIIAVAVIAFLVVLFFIYRDNIKEKIKNIFKKPKKKSDPKKEEKKPEINNDDFIPLKNQYDDERDISLQELLSDYETYDDNDVMINDDGEKLFVGDVFQSQQTQNNSQIPNFDAYSNNDLDFDKMFKNQFGSLKKSNKPIAEQIKDLSPELKAILVDSLLKKRDDV